jgi:hypothetical protein
MQKTMQQIYPSGLCGQCVVGFWHQVAHVQPNYTKYAENDQHWAGSSEASHVVHMTL